MIINTDIDLDDDDTNETLSEMGSVERGVYGIDKDGVYHMYYGSKSYFVEFKNTKIIKEMKKNE